MTGIEILYQEPIMVANLLHDILLVVGFFVMIVFIIMLSFVFLAKDRWRWLLVCLIGAVACRVLCAITTQDLSILMTESDRYKYEVTISEDVSMTEFYEKYDVIEQRGDIWVIEDKE